MTIVPNTNAIATQLVNSDTTTRQMTTDPVRAIPESMVQEKSVEANVTAIKAIDEMHGSLLDIKG
ncbi:hypothetical protein D1872_284230 [compost metagenome]